jgi:uncharacterized protein YjbJ (UPF0337 family)
MKNEKIKNKVNEITGNAKEVVGKLTGDKTLELEGNVQKNISKIRASYDDLRDSVKKTSEE